MHNLTKRPTEKKKGAPALGQLSRRLLYGHWEGRLGLIRHMSGGWLHGWCSFCSKLQWKARPRSFRSGALQERAEAGTSLNPGSFQTSSWVEVRSREPGTA